MLSEDDRLTVAVHLADLWNFQTSFMGELLRTLEGERVLSEQAVETMLQHLDRDADDLLGEDDRIQASETIAMVRELLGRWRATRH